MKIFSIPFPLLFISIANGWEQDLFPSAEDCECRSASDCPSNLACIDFDCQDPCEDYVCKMRTICKVFNHRPTCVPTVKRSRNHRLRSPKPGCIQNSDCLDTEICDNGECVDPCPSGCGYDAECTVIDHVTYCACPEGFTGNPYEECCSDDSQCEIQKSCNQGTCQNVCHTNACGTNAICAAQNHRPMCYCPAGHNGNPMVECTRSGCQNDNQCQTDQLCRNNQCTNPCLSPNNICAQQSQDCVTMNHKIQCFKASCSDNNQCQHNQFCFSSNCADVCTFSRCGENTLCTIQRSHQATCICKPETYGNPVHGCFYKNGF
uniref:CSON012590 protein n=1 Tax=Culicoides sonorensis TaxID=179676 RepID=A0A336M6G4_CULSO